MTSKSILVTGKDIDINYNRTLVILSGLKKLGYSILVFDFKEFNAANAKEIKRLSKGCYFAYIPSFGHKAVKFVKKNASCDVIFDPLISKYMTNVKDYNHYGSFSYEAARCKYRDQTSISKADFVIFDTRVHRDYFLNKYKIKKDKTGIVYVGANHTDFRPQIPKTAAVGEKFKVGFVGNFIPLQGVLEILKTANLLKNNPAIEFVLIGKGFEFEKALHYAKENELKNVDFIGSIEYSELDSFINTFDLCLGIFGNTFKSQVVIPNKIFNYAPCFKPILTMTSNAIKEIFIHKEHIYLCEPNPKAMAESILELKENTALRDKIACNIGKLVSNEFSEKNIALSLIEQYEEYRGVKAN
ncbi:glycosyl transferase family 1 [Salegentibacter sp. 24]|uniref:glycosyltransferase n=1 Tax=Salegentibacter sp. 24 TaxID=2183986 RepID=UPI00105D56B9|nr:glycosyltransferase [Salegentibacter sp. 24]TDN88753.1 glycosyl transferase family 1 [Salegentibacter sp. 24]